MNTKIKTNISYYSIKILKFIFILGFGKTKTELENQKEKEKIRLFDLNCNGLYYENELAIKPLKVPTFAEMQVTDLSFNLRKNELTVELVRPGILIGKRGSTIEYLEKELGYKIKVVEKKFY